MIWARFFGTERRDLVVKFPCVIFEDITFFRCEPSALKGETE